MSELALPSAGKGEFPRLQESLAEAQRDLDSASDGIATVLTSAASEGDDEARLAAHARAVAMLDSMKPRAAVFEKRAKEPDPDKRMYGPKMVQKVLDFCTALEAAVEHEEELRDSLEQVRARLVAANEADAAAKAAEAAAIVQAERAAAAERVAAQAAAEQVAAQAAAEEAERRAAAIAAPLFGSANEVEVGEDEVEADAMGRRPLVAGLSLSASLELLQSKASSVAGVAEALQALQALCVNVVARPEDASFRTVRLLNAAFQQSVARHAGGIEALLAMGFVEKDSLEDEEAIFYVLDEPNLENDYERWAQWYDGIKAHQAMLMELMSSLGVRPVPPASKGIGWNEATPTAKQPDMSDCLTLTREHGGAN